MGKGRDKYYISFSFFKSIKVGKVSFGIIDSFRFQRVLKLRIVIIIRYKDDQDINKRMSRRFKNKGKFCEIWMKSIIKNVLC